jgi:peptidoglycan hydrolase-like protein with peptidoglycan-binding domain
METLAYLHLATVYESPRNLEQAADTFDLKWFEKLNSKKLPSSAWIRMGALFISLAILSTTNVSLARGTFILQRGTQGSQVTALQQNLKTAGFYNGPITGFYGELTQASVIRFQQARGLRADGIAGPNTLSALGSTSPGGSSLPTGTLLRRGSRGTAVTQLQNTLKAAGFYNGPITGYYGQLTEAAVRRFQQARGLGVDGIAGSNTLLALGGASPGGSTPIGTELRLGSSGAAVSQLQNRLKAAGFYKGPITGSYGRLTEAAVRDFQSSRGLSVNGIVGPTTLAALQGNYPTNPTTVTQLQRGSRGSAVTQLQNRLRAAGFFNGPVTGYYGELTEAAVRNFQRSRGLSVNGIVGPTTLAALQGTSPGNPPIATQLRRGSSGLAVNQLQNQLRATGLYKGPITGYYGQLTEAAVRDFQRSRSLSVNGIVGPTTLAALQGISPGGNSTAIASLY